MKALLIDAKDQTIRTISYDGDYKNYPCKCGSNKCAGYIVREGSRWRIKNKKK